MHPPNACIDRRKSVEFRLRIVRRAGVDLEAVALGAFTVGALHQWIVAAGLDDGALGVVDDPPVPI